MEQATVTTLNQYQAAALRTSKQGEGLVLTERERRILNGALGLGGEAGEVSDIVKKAFMQGHPLKEDKILEELGDVLWYAALLADALGTTLEKVASANVSKLMERYPNGFSVADSLARVDMKKGAE